MFFFLLQLLFKNASRKCQGITYLHIPHSSLVTHPCFSSSTSKAKSFQRFPRRAPYIFPSEKGIAHAQFNNRSTPHAVLRLITKLKPAMEAAAEGSWGPQTMSPKNTNRGVAWLKREVNALLDIWTDQEIQDQLAGRLHNMCIYEKISRRLKELGFDRTGEQCREKIKKLRRDYRTVVRSNYSPAFARRLLGFYGKVHKIFGKTYTFPDGKNNTLNKDFGEENDLFPSDADKKRSAGSKNKISKIPDDYISKSSETITTDGEKLNENSCYKLTADNEKFIQNIYQNCTLLQQNLRNSQFLLNNKFLELEENRVNDRLQRERKRFSFLEHQRKKAKSQELELYETLLQVFADRNGFQIKFNDIKNKKIFV